MHIEFLVEDSSGKALLEILAPRVVAELGETHSWRIHSYRGVGQIPANLSSSQHARKRMLLDRLPRLLAGYANTPGIEATVIVVDSDRKDCKEFLKELQSMAEQCGAANTQFRIAIEEIEAWYLGDQEAIQMGYPNAKLQNAADYVQDSACGTWEVLAEVLYRGGMKAIRTAGWPLPGQLKHEWATQRGPHLDLLGNKSPSFNKFVEGLQRLLKSEAI